MLLAEYIYIYWYDYRSCVVLLGRFHPFPMRWLDVICVGSTASSLHMHPGARWRRNAGFGMEAIDWTCVYDIYMFIYSTVIIKLYNISHDILWHNIQIIVFRCFQYVFFWKCICSHGSASATSLYSSLQEAAGEGPRNFAAPAESDPNRMMILENHGF